MFYDYAGVTATASQFYLTDSSSHFFRGALYFNTQVSDSLLPVNNFLKEDIINLIESFRWKDNWYELPIEVIILQRVDEQWRYGFEPYLIT